MDAGRVGWTNPFPKVIYHLPSDINRFPQDGTLDCKRHKNDIMRN